MRDAPCTLIFLLVTFLTIGCTGYLPSPPKSVPNANSAPAPANPPPSTVIPSSNAEGSSPVGILNIASGGTGASTVQGARANLGVTFNPDEVVVAPGGKLLSLDGNALFNLDLGKSVGTLPIERGGTGATTAASARTSLGITNACLLDPNKIVQLDADGKLPMLDGSQLTGINVASATTAITASVAGFAEGRQGSDVVASPILALGNDGNFFKITSGSTISAFVPKPAGARVTLLFTGNSTLVDNQNSGQKLLLQGKGSFSTAGGNIFEFISLGAGDWQELSRTVTNESRVHAIHGASQTLNKGVGDILRYNSEVEDTQAEYDPSTGYFTAKQSGVYEVSATYFILTGSWTDGSFCDIALSVTYPNNGGSAQKAAARTQMNAGGFYCSASFSATLFVSVGTKLAAAVTYGVAPGGPSSLPTFVEGSDNRWAQLFITKVK